MFRASSCPSSGAYQLQQQQQHLVYRWNVVVAVMVAVLDPTTANRPKHAELYLNDKQYM
jgi:hypothetical protein